MDNKPKSGLVARIDGIARLARHLENELELARRDCKAYLPDRYCERTETMLREAHIVAINLARSIDEAGAWEESKKEE